MRFCLRFELLSLKWMIAGLCVLLAFLSAQVSQAADIYVDATSMASAAGSALIMSSRAAAAPRTTPAIPRGNGPERITSSA